MRFAAILLFSLAGLSAATEKRVLYNRKITPPSWNIGGRANPLQWVHFIIAVKQQNLKQLEEKFWAVADPKSPEWRKFMSIEEIDAMVASRDADKITVASWLEAELSKEARTEMTSDSIEVRCTVGDAEKLFDTRFFTYTHDKGHTIIRSVGTHSIPVDVHAAIDFVEGVADFPMHRAPVHKKALAQTSAVTPLVAPETLLGMYKVPADAKITKVSQGPAEFQDDQSFNKADLKTFFAQTDLSDETVTDIVGPFSPQVPDTEATLDVQYITSVGQKQTNWYWTADNWMYTWANNFYNAKEIPDAVSISWGWAEDQQCSAGIDQSECQTLGIDSEQFVKRVNTEFQKIGLRGVSLFVASGDSGANGRSDGLCTDKKLHASFPGSSPYVTSVGATQFSEAKYDLKNPPKACSSQGASAKCASGGVEVAVSAGQAGFTSGGGFSTYTPMPSYQEKVVAGYLSEEAEKLPPKSYFNSTNRAYPDISAMGTGFLIYMQTFGGWSTVGGTSAATPTVAGVSAYLNDLSYKKDGKPLGFLNPLFYQMHAEMPEAFTDVVHGSNKCTESTGPQCPMCKGYEAAKGWDPVTGLGTPVADKMLAYVEKLLGEQKSSPLVV
eukprot:gnl/TRDRNA2_/TRDRNA2_175650_c0_seq1.p1 gnl/TRDRNA2_/TRDRNA2_175650_c0~~gnl/TRDRNA2_/TRDRNA2_175650_c0_seq1.p1  ORF type:complete len:610 (-),score=150.65 gnl/TRDRNA2_/TRDRNA2_175650_c0_seq1:356-2185(-)